MVWSVLNFVLTLLNPKLTSKQGLPCAIVAVVHEPFTIALTTGGFLRVPFTNRPRIPLPF